MSEPKHGTCGFCGDNTTVRSFSERSPGRNGSGSYDLCTLCASTQAGNSLAYPENYSADHTAIVRDVVRLLRLCGLDPISNHVTRPPEEP